VLSSLAVPLIGTNCIYQCLLNIHDNKVFTNKATENNPFALTLFVLSYISETDTMFGGISAFPGRSTIVTGLKYKKKYKGYDARTPWSKDL
jgi:hypothetical protein